MPKLITTKLLILLILKPMMVMAAPEDDFVMTIRNIFEPHEFTIWTEGTGYNYNVDCNDDGINEGIALTGSFTCSYPGGSVYTIRIKDNEGDGTGFPRIITYIDEESSFQTIRSVEQWGNMKWQNMSNTFYRAFYVTFNASDSPDFSQVTDMTRMFFRAGNLNSNMVGPDTSSWDVSSVTDMTGMFGGINYFSPDVSNWNVSNVESMVAMFNGANIADPDVSDWDVSSVTNMSHMFSFTGLANPDVSDWDVSVVTDMSGMFQAADAADPDVSNWDVSAVKNMEGMFEYTEKANPDVSNWDVSSVTNMRDMFARSEKIDPDVSNWDVTSVTNMRGMFAVSKNANPDVHKWDVSSVTNMKDMFANSEKADPDVSNWDVSAVTDMSAMFQSTVAAYPDVSSWDVSSVVNMSGMFAGSKKANPDVSNWDVSSVTNMRDMFASDGMFVDHGNTDINPDVSNWDVSSVVSMSGMFAGSKKANPDVSNWDVSFVQSMSGMFANAESAIPDISSWQISNVNNMHDMFSGVSLPPRLYDKILISFSDQQLQDDVSFSGGNSYYCEAEAAKNKIINDHNWEITDGGLNCGADVSIEFGSFEQHIEIGQQSQAQIHVKNTGYQNETDILVTTAFADGFDNLSWVCEVAVGLATCPESNGTGELNELVDLSVADELIFTFYYEINSLEDSLVAEAKIDLNISEDDIYIQNNQDKIEVFISKNLSGSWFDPENPGHGVFLENLDGGDNGRVNMYWFTHHNDQPVWMVGASEIIDNQPLTIDLHIAEGADFPPDFDAGNVISNEWGQVTFNFDTSHDIKMSWDSLFSEFGSGSVDLTQLSAISESADGCYSGSFYSLDEPGHGLFIHITDMANEQKQINVAWFAFQDGEQLWLVGSGVFKKDGISTITLTQASGASFFDVNANQGWSFNSDDIMAAEWGVLRLSFTDQHNMFFNYQPNDLDHFQAGNLEMTRLTEIKGHGCE